MRARLATLAALGGIAVAAFPAHAATLKPKQQITDPAGDANGINQQAPGLGPEPPTVATGPADVAAADITGVAFKSTFITKRVRKHGVVTTVKVPTGFTVTMALAAAPSLPSIIYRVSAAAAGCGTNVFFEFTSGGATSVRCPDADLTKPSAVYATPAAVVKGNTITWTVPAKSMRVGTTLSTLNAQTRQQISTPVISATVPQYDYATSTATFTVGK